MAFDFERRCWAEIDLDNLRHNFRLIQKTAPNARVMAVVKANAYGHGDLVAARALADAGARSFAVSGLAEAVRLRRSGLRRPLLVLGYTSPQHTARLRVHNLAQCVFSPEYARQLSDAAVAAKVRVRVHFKVDTGMARLGFNAKDDFEKTVADLAEAYHLPGLRPIGLFTHFSAADSHCPEDVAYTEEQFALFQQVRQRLAALGCHFRYAHSCNSAATIAYPAMHLDIVRPGIALYGCNPSADVQLPGLRPAFSLKTAVTMVKHIKAGDAVSYGRTFIAPRPMRVATLAVGYADGYPRLLSGQGTVGICGQPAPLLGRVCMDQLVADVSGIEGVQLGSVATVFGGAGADSIDDVAAKSGTVNYEILCNIGRRVQRVYTEAGRETLLADYMEE
ncbi:MAG: alanine racemase [Oscillospiraceae bacterium]